MRENDGEMLHPPGRARADRRARGHHRLGVVQDEAHGAGLRLASQARASLGPDPRRGRAPPPSRKQVRTGARAPGWPSASTSVSSVLPARWPTEDTLPTSSERCAGPSFKLASSAGLVHTCMRPALGAQRWGRENRFSPPPREQGVAPCPLSSSHRPGQGASEVSNPALPCPLAALPQPLAHYHSPRAPSLPEANGACERPRGSDEV